MQTVWNDTIFKMASHTLMPTALSKVKLLRLSLSLSQTHTHIKTCTIIMQQLLLCCMASRCETLKELHISGVPGGVSDVQTPPPEIPKALQKNRAKLNPIVKTVKKNC